MNFFKNIWKLVRFIGAVLTVLLAIAYVVSAYAGKVDPSEDAKYAIIGLCYPIMLGLSVLVLVVWLVLRQWKIAMITLVSFVATMGPLLTYSPMNITSYSLSPEEKEKSFKLLTFNVMKFEDFDNEVHERNRTVQYILDTDADLVCLQEGTVYFRLTDFKLIKNMVPELLERYPYYTKGINDMVLLSKFPFKESDERIVKPYAHNVVPYEVYIGNDTLKIYNCHLQSIGLTSDDKETYLQLTEIDGAERDESKKTLQKFRSDVLSKLAKANVRRSEQARGLRHLIDSVCVNKNVIVCGDFNDTPGSFSYRTIRGEDMSDAYIDCAFGPTITYHDNRFYFRIDHILYRGSLKAVDIERGDIGSSDHYPLLATFILQ